MILSGDALVSLVKAWGSPQGCNKTS